MDQEKQDLAIQWALGQLDSSSANRLESEFEADPELKAFALEIRETFTAVSFNGPRAARPLNLARKVARAQKRKNRIAASLPWAGAACLAILALFFGIDRGLLQHRVRILQASQNLARLQIASLQGALAAYKDSTVVIIWDPKTKTGVAQLRNMPPASPGKDYQLWVVDPQNPVPVSAGVLRVANDEEVKISFIPDKPVNSVSKFVISVEPAGGVPKSVGPAILVSN